MLQVGRVGKMAFMRTTYCRATVKYLGIASGYGSNTQWKYCSAESAPESGSQLPDNCLTASTSDDVISDKVRAPLNADFQFPFPELNALPDGTTKFTVTIKGTKAVYIILSPTQGGLSNDVPNGSGITKIMIGAYGWSGVMCNIMKPWEREATALDLLSETEAKQFVVEFDDYVVRVSLLGKTSFLQMNRCPGDVKYFGVASAYDASAEWTYCPSAPVAPRRKECWDDSRGRDYRGNRYWTDYDRTTQSTSKCQKWTEQTPNEHNRTPQNYPFTGLGDHNYCRNPDNDSGGPWCYTVDGPRWAYCKLRPTPC
ncbi:uncharacterized protein [Amphiura filiformis]|uniref:uncharacterized protein n=1 Tax=Amphiura filiformis TaxID=82378 RepID=UPI003B20D813